MDSSCAWESRDDGKASHHFIKLTNNDKKTQWDLENSAKTVSIFRCKVEKLFIIRKIAFFKNKKDEPQDLFRKVSTLPKIYVQIHLYLQKKKSAIPARHWAACS